MPALSQRGGEETKMEPREYLWQEKRWLGIGKVYRMDLYVAFDGEVVGSIFKGLLGNWTASLEPDTDLGEGKVADFVCMDAALTHLMGWAKERDRNPEPLKERDNG